MKNLFFVFLLLLSLGAWAKDEFTSPDIIVDSKLDYNWSGLLIKKFRVLMKNYGINDPFKARYEEPIIIVEDKVKNYLGADSLEMVNDFGNVIGLELANTKTKVEISGFSYEVNDFTTDMKSSDELRDGLVLSSDISASELQMSADKISFSLSIPLKSQNGLVPLLNVEVIGARISAKENRLINFFAKVKIQDDRDSYKFNIVESDFKNMARVLLESPESVDFRYERLVIPHVSLKIGNKKIDISPDRIENYMRERHEAIKSILIAQMAQSLTDGTAHASFKVLEKYKLQKEYWFESSIIKSQVLISQFSSTQGHKHLDVKLPADFCTAKKFTLMKQKCLGNKDTAIAETRIDSKLHRQSIAHMKDIMDAGEANIIASVSEDYLNKLLVTTYDAGLWKEALESAGVVLGPGKVTLRLDKKGDSGTFFMDVAYKPTTLERVALGQDMIQFPLVLDVSLRVEERDGDPFVIVRLNDVDLSDKTLLIGRPDLGYGSNIGAIPRFKGKVLSTIRGKVQGLRGRDIVNLKYRELRGLSLDKVDFISDGNGRMNGLMRLEDILQK